ncbi:MAG TPA: TetR/AcrR family transcriptional regulator [Candidatus Lachnoclostridium stercorigallinarum]|uniref:TetR/AcrR family transcriptional regulator n=1 Tax=Candidatus Lachnoclostridium stercorigallinarum TaxID=2838634 RepID=A0A9D2K6D7_9FIRM|nr:TetR/AcrR family transcriptional regulator [Candidatus Lachnoclostridium stercorigallinarum]
MKESNMDRRIRKTKQQVRQSVTILLKQKRIQDITVRELAELADINRGTFYLHYRDVYDLLNQIEDELLDELESVLSKYQPGSILPNTAQIFTDVYELVQRNSELAGILLGDNGEWNFINRLNQILREKCLRDWVEHFRTENHETFDSYYIFIISGCMGLVQHWLKNGMKETPQELAALTEQIIMNGIKWMESA